MRECFFFNDTATTEIYTLSLHDALPICRAGLAAEPFEGRESGVPRDAHVRDACARRQAARPQVVTEPGLGGQDRKSTRLNSSHANISYAVFCLKKNKNSVLSTTTQSSTS